MDALKRASALHQEVGMIDAHLDLGGIIDRRVKRGEKQVLQHYFLEDFKKAGVKLVVAAIFVEREFLPEMGLRMALDQIDSVLADIEACSEHFMPVFSADDLKKVWASDKIGIILSLEGAEPIGNDLKLLNNFYRLGVRGFGVAWSRRNYVADGSYFGSPEEGIRGGLTPFGIEVIRQAEALGMFIDISHLNDEGVADVFKRVKRPVIASHSDCRHLNDIRRNLTDSQLDQVAADGGVVGINAYKTIVSQNPGKQNVAGLCDHVEHMIHTMGYDHVGFGFDLCRLYYDSESDVDVLHDHSEALEITAELLRRGHAEEDLKKIIGGNFRRYFESQLI
ncbi:MAG: rane dipeptidase [Clostridiales bacterium]|jgi:membrane dipeptidase|nr:rane dipeptidase [Clostridiales bacterium]